MSVKRILDELADKLSERDCERFEPVFEDFMRTAEIAEDDKRRILSSVMRKAGHDLEMNGTAKIQKKKRYKKILSVIAIAAALFVLFAVGAVAYFADRTGLLNGLKGYFSDSENITEGEIRALDEVTSYKGEFRENTFADAEVSFSGAMYADNTYTAVFTLRKTDGTPFTAPEGYVWRTGFTDVGLDLFFDRTVKSYVVTPQCFINEDGSLSVTVNSNGFYQPQFKKYTAGFTNLYCVPEDHTINCEESTKRWELASKAREAYDTMDNEQYEQRAEEFFAYSESIAADSIIGEVKYVIDLSDTPDSTLHLELEMEGQTVSLRLSPIGIDMEYFGSGDCSRYSDEDSLPVTIVYKDGSSFGAKRTYFMSGGNEKKCAWSVGFYPDRPIDMAQVDHIMFGDKELRLDE